MTKLLLLFIGTNLINPILSTYNQKNQTDNISWLDKNDFKIVMKQSSIVGDDGGSQYKTEQNVEFKLKFKHVYMSSSKTNPKFDFLLDTFTQLTPVNNDNKNYGGVYWREPYDELRKNVERIQDWTIYYKNNLSLDLADLGDNFGVSMPKLLVNSGLVLKKGWINSTNLKCPVAFATNDEKQTIINDPLNFVPLVYKRGTESTTEFNGLPFAFYRESTNKKMFMILGHGFFYALDATTSNNNGHKIVPFLDNTFALINNYQIKNLISIVGANYQNKTIQLGVNQDLLARAKKLQEKHKQTLRSILPKLKNKSINMIKMFVSQNMLGIDNIDGFIAHSNKLEDATNWLKNNESQEIKYAKKLGFNSHDNPYPILNSISDKLTFNIYYQISNVAHPNQWSGKMKTCSYQDLLSHNVNLNLNPNETNQYKFRLVSIKSNEVNDGQCYIQSDETNEINNESNNIELNNNIYSLQPLQIRDVSLKPNNFEFNKNYFTHELSDKSFINEYVSILTNYPNIDTFDLLNSSNYKIRRNELLGSMEIEINYDSKHLFGTYSGFKQIDGIISNINGSLDKMNLIAEDLNEKEIHLLLQLNGIDAYIANNLHFSIQNIDNAKGEAKICIIDCDDLVIKNNYLNKTFYINNMQPYFIKQKDKLDAAILAKRPIDISVDDVKNNLIDVSIEFKNRNYDNLNIELTPFNDRLIVNISYIDLVKHNLQFSYAWTKKSLLNNINIWWIIGGIISLVIVLIFGYCLWRKFKQLPQTPDNQQL